MLKKFSKAAKWRMTHWCAKLKQKCWQTKFWSRLLNRKLHFRQCMKVFVHVNVFTVQVCAFCALRSSDMQLFAYLMPATHAPETGNRNCYQKLAQKI